MGKYHIMFFSILLLFSPLITEAQAPKVEGYFMQDSAKLGERVAYVLKASYSPGTNLIFPDSTYTFGEDVAFLEKKSFITSTRNDVTVDSAVYYVSNFSLNPVLQFSLPVYEVLKYDSIIHYPEEANLALKLMIDPIPKELMFEDNNIYQPLETQFNYPLAFLILGILAVIALVLIFVFGNRIQKMWAAWLEKRKYRRFLRRWENAEKAFAAHPDMAHADELLGLWKTYMEHLKNKPFREWTTSEISDFLENKAIINDFREIELIIYAGRNGKNIAEACKNLKEVCHDSYQQKLVAQDDSK